MQKPSKQLQDKWKQKLKDSGFEDIEQEDGNLVSWHSMYYMLRYTSAEFAEKQEYYRLARHYLEAWPFDTDRQRRVWELMELGKTYGEIAKIIGVSSRTISTEVSSLLDRRVWKYYSEGQTMVEIAKKLPISRAGAHLIVKKIRERVKSANID